MEKIIDGFRVIRAMWSAVLGPHDSSACMFLKRQERQHRFVLFRISHSLAGSFHAQCESSFSGDI